MNTTTSSTGLSLIKSFEGCSLKAYLLKGEHYYTIGYGHSFDSSITSSTVWTQEQAESQLVKDLKTYEAYVIKDAVSKFPSLNQYQFDALVSYCYNRGRGGLQQLIKNSASISDVAANIPIYWGSATLYKSGLLRRRYAEQSLFKTVPVVVTKDVVIEDKELGSAVSKIIKSGIQLEYNKWKRKDLIKILNTNHLLCKLAGVKYKNIPTDANVDEAIDKLVDKKVISSRSTWDPESATYNVNNVRSLLIKFAAKC